MVEAPAAYAPRAVAVLTVRRAGHWVYLNAEAARALPAGHEYTADLRPPARARDGWHLDVRPGGPSTLAPVGTTGGLRFRAPARVHALLSALAPPHAAQLRLALVPTAPGLYALQPLL